MTEEQIRILTELYKSLWEDIRDRERNLATYAGTLVAVLAALGFGYVHPEDSLVMLAAAVAAQAAALWLLFVTFVAADAFRVHQALSARIERAVLLRRVGILPRRYRRIRHALTEIYRVHAWVLHLLFVVIPLGWYLVVPTRTSSAASFCGSVAITGCPAFWLVLLVSILGTAVAWGYWWRRGKRFRRDFPDVAAI